MDLPLGVATAARDVVLAVETAAVVLAVELLAASSPRGARKKDQ